jgi:hypothetical protein
LSKKDFLVSACFYNFKKEFSFNSPFLASSDYGF